MIRRRFPIVSVLALAAACQGAFAQTKCAVNDFRIASARELDLRCKLQVPQDAQRDVTLYQLDSEGQRVLPPIHGHFTETAGTHWSVITLDSDLKTGNQYQIKDPSASASPAFDLYSFSTKPAGKLQVIDDPAGKPGKLLILQSSIALDPTTLSAATSAITDSGAQPTPLTLVQNQNPDTRLVGQATGKIYIRSHSGQTVDVSLSGVKDILSGNIQAQGSYSAPATALTQSASTYYAKFDGQAGVGQKPGYTVEASATPVLANLGRQLYFVFNANADLGFGSSDTGKITDMIKLGTGGTRYFARPRIELTPLLQYETDRHGNHRNLLFDGESQYFGRNWRRSIAQRNYDEYSRRVLAGGDNAPTDPKEINLYHTGFLFEAHLGTEIGGALSSQTVKSSDKKTSVTLPTYRVARIKPSVNATAEFRQVSLTATVTPRYLFSSENVTRETTVPDPTTPGSTIQSIYLQQAKNLRTMGSLAFLWALDPAGHFSLSVSYKAGSEPPNFNHVNQVETGLVLIY